MRTRCSELYPVESKAVYGHVTGEDNWRLGDEALRRNPPDDGEGIGATSITIPRTTGSRTNTETPPTATHRSHFARVFGLPLMALVRTCQLPRTLIVIDHPDRSHDSALGDGFGRFASLWAGLRKRGLLDVAGDPELARLAEWTPTLLCAEWMLLPPAAAAAVNRGYGTVYPGALTKATSLSAEKLHDPNRWARAVVKSLTCHRRACCGGRGSGGRNARSGSDSSGYTANPLSRHAPPCEHHRLLLTRTR